MDKVIATKTQENILNALLLDSTCFKALDRWIGEFNIFDTLGISRWEIKHSNILAWLLSPSENHNLGTDFLNGIIEKILSGNPDIEHDALDLLLLNTSFTVSHI